MNRSILSTFGVLFGLFALIAPLRKVEADAKTAPVMVQDFEKPSSLPPVWVVNIPNKNASVQISTTDPFEGKQCLKLHYHFTGILGGEYLGIPNKISLQNPVHRLHFMLNGDHSGCGIGVRLVDTSGETHQYKAGFIDFAGWKQVTIDLDAPHETWDGDKNGKLDFPVTSVVFIISPPPGKERTPLENDLSFDALSVDSDKSGPETLGSLVSVVSPAYCADIKGSTKIVVAAPGYKTITAHCWKQGSGFGADSVVATVALDAQGGGSFTFPADRYPHGPVTLTLTGTGETLHDHCDLQLYNIGGVHWNDGIPKMPPPPAQGMSLVFADDFTGPLSISSTDPKALYYDHKPPNGSQDFSSLPFTGTESASNPFHQQDGLLRIRASEKAHSAGLISSIKNDGSGIKVSLPCYFECRMLGPNAIGTWPAFWLMTDYLSDKSLGDKTPVDELDIIEAYGGEGAHEPNSGDRYQITPHAWNQGDAGKALGEADYAAMHNPQTLHAHGIPSTWYETFHTYGCKITATDTIYYCDNIEMGRHPTLPVSRTRPFFFMVNLATGGGWPVDLSRYGGLADLYVDYIRVYKE